MSISKCLHVVALAGMIFVSALAFAQGQANCKFSYFSIDNTTSPNAINDKGEIVGEKVKNSVGRGYTRTPTGQTTLYLVPGSILTSFLGANDTGTKVGIYVANGTSTDVGLVLQGNKRESVHHPGDTWGTSLNGINSAGEIVGWYLDNNEFSHGFTFQNSTFSDVNYPGATWTTALGLNNSGTVVGYYTFSDGTGHGFIASGSRFTSVDFPGSLATSFNGISSRGVVLGTTRLPQNELWTPFLYKNNRFEVVSAPNADITNANGISPKGVLTGNAHFSDGWKGFTATCK